MAFIRTLVNLRFVHRLRASEPLAREPLLSIIVPARDAAVITLLQHFELRGLGENAAMPMLAFFIYVVIPTWFATRTRAGALALGGGPGNLVARDAYDAAGGHPELRDAVIDDVG